MDYLSRFEKLRLLLPEIPCDALLIDHPIHLLYLTGLELSVGRLLVTSQEASLFVDGRYLEVCRKNSPYPVCQLEDDSLKKWMIVHAIKSLAFEREKTSYQTFLNLQRIAEELRGHSVSLSLIPVESPVQKLRQVKDQDEIDVLRQAARLAWKGYEFVVSHLKEGITESELAFELEFFWKKKGAKRLAFDPIIAFGANSSMPHYRAGETALMPGMSVLIDIGVVWKHYHSDLTRVVFFGDPPPQIKEIYAVVEESKQQALAICKPGRLIKELDLAARQLIASKGYGEYFIHSLGHGLGLEIHEPPTLHTKGPFSDKPLQSGMVITIEPGIYLPDIGGVRLEDTILLTADGYDNLTSLTLT